MPGRLIRRIREGTPGVVIVLFAIVVILTVISSCRVENVARDARELSRQNRVLVKDGLQAHDALCVFRDDLDNRADQGEQFIADIVAGKRDPIPGITIPDLQRSVAGQRSTLKALSVLDC